MKEYFQEHTHGIVGTIAFHGIIIAIMLSITLARFEPIFPDDPEGVTVNFGTDETGLGDVEPGPNDVVNQPVSSPEETQQATSQPTENTEVVATETPTEPSHQEIATQDFEDAAAIAAQKKADDKKKKDELVAQQQQQAETKKNQDAILAQQQAEAKRIADENARKAQEKQNMAGKLFGKGSGNGSQGIAGGEGNQGKADGVAGASNYDGGGSGNGTGNGKGVGYSLNGRSAVDLPRPPKGIQAEGKVVVEILVDRNGNVIDARPGVKGTNTNNERLYQAAKDAAVKAKFNVSANSPERQKGTLTYIFELQ